MKRYIPICLIILVVIVSSSTRKSKVITFNKKYLSKINMKRQDTLNIPLHLHVGKDILPSSNEETLKQTYLKLDRKK